MSSLSDAADAYDDVAAASDADLLPDRQSDMN